MTIALSNDISISGQHAGVLSSKKDLYRHLYSEAYAMLKHALSNGLSVPTEIVEVIGAENPEVLANTIFDDNPPNTTRREPSNSGNSNPQNSENQSPSSSSSKSANFADVDSGSDKEITDSKSTEQPIESRTASMSESLVENDNFKILANAHQQLARIVSPATPGTIRFLQREKKDRTALLLFLGPVPLVRRLSVIAMFFLVGVIGIGSMDLINPQNLNKGILESSGWTVILTQMFLLCCAGLGASFNGLFKVNHYIANATYDSKYDSTYLTRVILGLIAGMIIVELLPKELFERESLSSFGKPTLAVLAGYSAHLVYQILQRLADTLESFVKGDQQQVKKFDSETQKAKLDEQRTTLHSSVASRLIEVQNKIDSSATSEDAKSEINKVVKDLLPAVR